jgi:hypothetical protein
MDDNCPTIPNSKGRRGNPPEQRTREGWTLTIEDPDQRSGATRSDLQDRSDGRNRFQETSMEGNKGNLDPFHRNEPEGTIRQKDPKLSRERGNPIH